MPTYRYILTVLDTNDRSDTTQEKIFKAPNDDKATERPRGAIESFRKGSVRGWILTRGSIVTVRRKVFRPRKELAKE